MKEMFVVKGGKHLKGSIKIDSCKNAILPILAGSILCKGVVKIKKCTMYVDVVKMCDILKHLGAKITLKRQTLIVDNSNLKYAEIPSRLTKDIRASLFTLAPMLNRFKKAKLAYPGGCNIGARGIDLHKALLSSFGAEIRETADALVCKKGRIKQREVTLPFVSVGATENAIMYACNLKGEFVIHNPAKEPEIVDLANFLNKMGAKIVGAGTDCITICGVDNLYGVEYTPISDRIIAGTMLIAGAITSGKILVKNCQPQCLVPLIDILKKSGCKMRVYKNKIKIIATNNLCAIGKIKTNPYPEFATDLQPQIVVLATQCKGSSSVVENVFETRFKYVDELTKMGAIIDVNGNCATIRGQQHLVGGNVVATDLRGGVALVLAGLVAKGKTQIQNIGLIDRGYFRLEKQLKKLGANIQRINLDC